MWNPFRKKTTKAVSEVPTIDLSPRKVAKLYQDGNYFFAYWCPGCNRVHTLDESYLSRGNSELVAFYPSLDYETTPFLDYRDLNKVIQYKCYNSVDSGFIKFFPSSTHKFRGQELELENVIPHLNEEYLSCLVPWDLYPLRDRWCGDKMIRMGRHRWFYSDEPLTGLEYRFTKNR